METVCKTRFTLNGFNRCMTTTIALFLLTMTATYVLQTVEAQFQVGAPGAQPVAQPQPVNTPGASVGINTQQQFIPFPTTAAPQPQQPLATVTDSCLQCICLASTNCKPVSCHLNGPSQYYCGPYLISWAYWADAGKPNDNINNPYAFEKCLGDLACSATTIRQYMAKHVRDCDGNGIIDCKDFARIHKAGPSDCQAKWVDDTPYWKTFSKCVS